MCRQRFVRSVSIVPVLVLAQVSPAQQFGAAFQAGTYRSFGRADVIAAADLNGDGAVDILLADQVMAAGLLLLENDGTGRMQPRPIAVTPPYHNTFTVGDVDGDGDLDIVAQYTPNAPRLTAWRNDGRGSFTQDHTSFSSPTQYGGYMLSLFDADRDGDLDLVASDAVAGDQIHINDGTGRFTDETASRMPTLVPGRIRPVDLDRDGWIDLVAGVPGGLEVRTNDGTGRFVANQFIPLPNGTLRSWPKPVVGDVDGDGDDDVLGLQWGQNVLLINDGRGALSYDARRLPQQLSLSHDATFVDVDEDGDLDLVVANGWVTYPQYYPWIHVNDGRGFYADETVQRLGIAPIGAAAVAVADFDGDLDPDLVFTAWYDTPLFVFANRLRHVEPASSVRIGTSLPVGVLGDPGFATSVQWAVPLADTVRAGSPIRTPLGALFVPPTAGVFPPVALAPPIGAGVAFLPVPNAPHLVGQTVHVRALVVHSAGRYGLTQLSRATILP